MPVINFSGLASGIDSEALIEATSKAQRQLKVNPKETKITELDETNSALSELKTMLTSLQSILRRFSSLGGGIVGKQAVSSDESVLTAAASNAAKAGTYNLTVTQLAKNGTTTLASAGRTYTSASDPINPDIVAAPPLYVNVQVGLGTEQESIDVEVTATTTLDEFVSDYNANANKSVATVINVGTASAPDYQIMITSDNQGTEKGTIAVTVDPAISGAGLGAFDDNSLSQATNAIFTMDGVGGNITRSSNTINDLIQGVTFNLSGTGSATVTISNDQTATMSAVKEFIEKYNEIVQYINENNQVTREEDGEEVNNVFAALAKTRVDDGILGGLRGNLASSSITDGSADTVTIFAAMGIATERDGTLKFNETEFKTAFDSEPEAINQLFLTFSDTAALTGGTIDQYIRFNGLFDVTSTGNKTQISNLNDQIARAEQIIAQQEAAMRQRFARLESLMGRLQNQQQSLASILTPQG